MNGAPEEGTGKRAVPSVDRNSQAYAEAHRMLDRYGIGYIYQHPEVLLGIAPGSGLADELSGRSRAVYGRTGARLRENPLRHPRSATRLEWLLMTYDALESVFPSDSQGSGARYGGQRSSYDHHNQARSESGHQNEFY